MTKQLLAGLLFVFGFAIGVSAQATPATPDDPPPAPPSATITVGQSTCGRTSIPISCLRVPVAVDGTAITQMQIGQSQVFFYDVNNQVVEVVHIDNETVEARNALYQPTQIAFSFTSMSGIYKSDPDGDGDHDTVMGGFTLNLSWYYGGNGRTAGWYSRVTGGSGAQTIAQD